MPKAASACSSTVRWVSTPAAPGAAKTSTFLAHCLGRAVRTSPPTRPGRGRSAAGSPAAAGAIVDCSVVIPLTRSSPCPRRTRPGSVSPAMRRPPSWLLHPLALFAGSRLVTLPAFGVSMLLTPGSNFAKVLREWDGGWYLNVAANGYPRHVPTSFGPEAQTTIAFFPLFPALARGVSEITGLGLETSAMVIVLLCGAASAVLLWQLVARLRDAATADRAVALFVFFPGTMVFSMVYSEALAVMLVIGCCWALVERRWVIAGVLGALATATRPNTGAVVLAAAVAAAIAV